MTNTPSDEEVQDFLLSCRYGELDEVKAFVERYGKEAVVSARDDRGNTALHMCCGNGHVGEFSCSTKRLSSWSMTGTDSTDIIEYLLPQVPSSFLAQTNENGSPALHWAILNNHVAVVQLLVEVPEEQGGGLPLLKVRTQFQDPTLRTGLRTQLTTAKKRFRSRCVPGSTIWR